MQRSARPRAVMQRHGISLLAQGNCENAALLPAICQLAQIWLI
jgi:hypothetical protein